METLSKRLSTKELPNWIPDEIKSTLIKETSLKEPMDITSPEVIGKYFVNKAEIDDVLEIINQVKKPIFIGMHGSRVTSERPPLFININSFEKYFKENRNIEKYKTDIKYRDLAKTWLISGFNESYKRADIKYIPEVTTLLVRDIDILIIQEDNPIFRGQLHGNRTNVPMDIFSNSPFGSYWNTPQKLEDFLCGLKKAIPLKY